MKLYVDEVRDPWALGAQLAAFLLLGLPAVSGQKATLTPVSCGDQKGKGETPPKSMISEAHARSAHSSRRSSFSIRGGALRFEIVDSDACSHLPSLVGGRNGR